MRRVLLFIALGIGLVLIGLVAFAASLPPCGGDELPMGLPIGSVGFGYVHTDQGRLYPGQTYRFMNEGPWVGSMTLLFATNARAFLLVRYPLDYPTNEVRAVCRDTYP